jgi:CBS domain containing-hemolysin-like protein
VVVHKRLSFMLSGAQLGITVTSLVIGFIAEPTFGRALEPLFDAAGLPESAQAGVALTVGLVVATAAQMVVGELAPKSIAIARAEPVARTLAQPIAVFLRVAGPLIRLFDGAANWLLSVLGIEAVEELHDLVSIDEIDMIVEESVESGDLTPRQAALLIRAVEFGNLQASHVMVPWNEVVTLPAQATGDDLRQVMADTAHSRFPVVETDTRVAGVVHAKDLLPVPAARFPTVRIGELAGPVSAVPETASLRVVLDELRQRASEMALVVDEYGAPAGVVTLEDLVEELVGDIADEHDIDGPDATRHPDGSWTVPGRWRLDEVTRATTFDLPAGDYETIAGLVLARLERLAVPGDRVVVNGVVIEVVDVDTWTITRVRVRSAPRRGGEDR